MNKNEIFRKIGGIIDELNDQYQYLSQNVENLSDLELELFLANSNFLSDHVEILRKLNHAATPKPAVTPMEIIEKKPMEEEPVQLVAESSPEPAASPLFTFDTEEITSFDYEQKGVEELFDRELTAEEQQIIDSKKDDNTPVEVMQTISEITEAKVEEIPEKAKEDVLVSEIITKETTQASLPAEALPAKPTINDLISGQQGQLSMASRLGQKTGSDLKSMISLNDKLLFVKDLFNGYSLAYSEAIELVNRFDNFESADNFLRLNYAAKNNWEAKSETVDKLYEILNRRFAKQHPSD